MGENRLEKQGRNPLFHKFFTSVLPNIHNSNTFRAVETLSTRFWALPAPCVPGKRLLLEQGTGQTFRFPCQGTFTFDMSAYKKHP